MDYVAYFTECLEKVNYMYYSGDNSLTTMKHLIWDIKSTTKASYHDSTDYTINNYRDTTVADFNNDLKIITDLGTRASLKRKTEAFEECKDWLQRDISKAIGTYKRILDGE